MTASERTQFATIQQQWDDFFAATDDWSEMLSNATPKTLGPVFKMLNSGDARDLLARPCSTRTDALAGRRRQARRRPAPTTPTRAAARSMTIILVVAAASRSRWPLLARARGDPLDRAAAAPLRRRPRPRSPTAT